MKLTTPRNLRVAGACLALTAALNAPAFEPEFHRDITRLSLGLFSAQLSDGTTIRFSKQRIALIAGNNMLTDVAEATEPRLHFDSERLVPGAELARANRRDVVTLLLATASSPAAQTLATSTALVKLGNVLHATQDFYSHSTWLDRGMSGIADLSGPTLDSRLHAMSAIGSACEGDASSVIDASRVSSGYFNTVPGVVDFISDKLTLGFVIDAGSIPAGKCKHGLKTETTSRGINKDRANENPLHANAKARALQETDRVIERILTELRGNDAALCRLMADDKGCTRWMYKLSSQVSVPFGAGGLPVNQTSRVVRYATNGQTTQDVSWTDPVGTYTRAVIPLPKPSSTQDVQVRLCRTGNKWQPFTRSYTIQDGVNLSTFSAYNLATCSTTPVPPVSTPLTTTVSLTESGQLTVRQVRPVDQAVAGTCTTGTITYNLVRTMELNLPSGTVAYHEQDDYKMEVANNNGAGTSGGSFETRILADRSDTGTYDITQTTGDLDRLNGTVEVSEEAMPADCATPLAFCTSTTNCVSAP